MDILAICGSPRKNKTTHSMLKAILDGAGRSYEIIWPTYLDIGHCLGCLSCMDETPGKCVQDDDMTGVIEKMFEAKSLIMVSPTYYGNVPGPLKTLIDRSMPTCYTGEGDEWQQVRNHGTRPFKGRPAMIVGASGGGDHEKMAANLRLVLEYYEYNIIGEYVEGMGGIIVTKEYYPDIYQELFDLGQRLDAALT